MNRMSDIDGIGAFPSLVIVFPNGRMMVVKSIVPRGGEDDQLKQVLVCSQ